MRIPRIELRTQPWQGCVIPFNYIRIGILARIRTLIVGFGDRSSTLELRVYLVASVGVAPTISWL